MSIVNKIINLYPDLTYADFGSGGTIQIRDDGEGPYISAWTHPAYPMPTKEMIDSSAPKSPRTAYPTFTTLEMLDQFTEAEQLAVVAATMTEPAIKLWYDRLIAATYVTYEDPRTEAGLQALVDAELITSQRKAEIVAAMQPQET